ncbi:MAG TPA: T9SS type A sorting domain-containing protein, partial [Flavobacteriales bacterium]|nr:T9SS type A sorting domain-containing protein [Flavobacteriales bacterium]
TPAPRNLNTDIYFTFGAMNRDPDNDMDSEYFNGALDDVRIYKGRCLSQAEIDTLAQDLLTLNIMAPEALTSLAVYPNPANMSMTINPRGTISGTYTLAIADASGRTILTKGGCAGPVLVDLANIPPGPYVINLTGRNGEARARFIKE